MAATSVKSGQYRDLDKLLQALMTLPPAPYIPIKSQDFNPDEGYEIGMNCAGVTDAASARPMLGTYGLDSCMAVAAYNPKTKTGGIVHLAQGEGTSLMSGESRLDTLQGMLQSVGSNIQEPLEVRLNGPGPRTRGEAQDSFIRDVLASLNKTPNLTFLSADFNEKPYSRAVGIDTRRWEEGLLKGARTSGITLQDISAGAEEVGRRIIESTRHVVEIEDMPAAPTYDDNNLFDGRSLSKFTDRFSPPPGGGPPRAR